MKKKIKIKNNQKEKDFKNNEDFLENNLSNRNSNFNINNEEEQNEERERFENGSLSSKIDNPTSSQNQKEKTENKKDKEILIFIKHNSPKNHISKIEYNNSNINNLIPRKKRLFITKKIKPIENVDSKNTDQNKIDAIPVSSLCLTTKKNIIMKEKTKSNKLSSINNDYSFFTKLCIKKESPKIYPSKIFKRDIVSPNKVNLFRTNKKLRKIKKKRHSSGGDKAGPISGRGGSKEDQLVKRIKKKERISVISKDKINVNSSQKDDNKERSNIITKMNNDDDKIYINEFSDNLEGNRIDISIQFSNEPINFNNTTKNKNKFYSIKKNNKKEKEIKDINNKCFSTTKKSKNIKDSLYKDLLEMNNKLENKDYNSDKHHYNIDYQKHYGDERTCPICREMRKRGRKMEKEKGLFHAFNFKNYKMISKKALNRFKMYQSHKTQGNNNNNSINNNSCNKKKEDLLSDDEKKKDVKNIFNNFNKYKNSEFRKKYLQFNGISRLNKINRLGSTDNFMNYINSRNESIKKMNEKKIEENSDDIHNNSEYPVLKFYFHDDNYIDTNN